MKNAERAAYPETAEFAGYNGVTKREYFAGLAMQGILASIHECVDVTVDGITRSAYELADAMCAEGDKK